MKHAHAKFQSNNFNTIWFLHIICYTNITEIKQKLKDSRARFKGAFTAKAQWAKSWLWQWKKLFKAKSSLNLYVIQKLMDTNIIENFIASHYNFSVWFVNYPNHPKTRIFTKLMRIIRIIYLLKKHKEVVKIFKHFINNITKYFLTKKNLGEYASVQTCQIHAKYYMIFSFLQTIL